MTSPSRLVSVIDSEETLRESICRAIRLDGHRADAFADPDAAWVSFGRVLPDLTIVEVSPGSPAADLCRRLRERAPTLSIIAAPPRESDLDGVLDLRADDYLCKPFSLRELIPRVKVLLRRASLTGAETLAWEDRPMTLGPLTVDPLRLSAQWGGRDLALTVTEFFLLHSLVGRAGVVKTRDQLLQDAFPGRSSSDSPVERHVARLRAKFELLEPAFDALEGVHGAGYRYRSGPATKRRTVGSGFSRTSLRTRVGSGFSRTLLRSAWGPASAGPYSDPSARPISTPLSPSSHVMRTVHGLQHTSQS